ncbi:MAG: prolipoprotein diacylglyceryl transferase [Clostridiales bacterium]|jgi:phosphatidylglycerol:prolipoprotein diacylglycerol transferase|nr:prolipoprotein diacylglyceryl transferase [Clostridiales bacterium]
MLPTITIFGKTIAMYGLMITLGIFIGVMIAILRRRKYNISKDDVLFSSCYGGIGLVVGAKLLYIITITPILIKNWNFIMSNFKVLYNVLSGGFVFYGGLIGAIIGYYLYCRQYKIDFIMLMDLMAPSIPIIHGIGRIGCFFAGCCYGIHYDGPLHIVFENSIAAPNGIPMFPTQLVESVLNILAGILLILYTRRERKSGKVIGLYVIYYSIMRFFLEFLRGDISRGIILSLSTSQLISILLLPLGLYLFFKPRRF